MKTLLFAAAFLISFQLSHAGENGRRKYAAYTVSELPTASGADYLQPKRINNRGEVLGKLDFSSGPFLDEAHVGLLSGGITTDLHLLVPGNETNRTSLPIDLNDRGQALFYVGSVPERSFLYEQGALADVNVLFGRDDFSLFALNDDGNMVGTTVVDNDAGEAFLFADGSFQLLGLLPGLPRSTATAINDRGRIVGWAGDGDDGDENRSVFFRSSGVVDLHIPGAAIDINNRGDILGTTYLRRRGGKVLSLPFAPAGFNKHAEVVGSSIVNSLDSRAMLFVRGNARDLNDLIDPASGWRLIHAYDINDHGQIVGWGRINNRWGGFLLTPNRHRQPAP